MTESCPVPVAAGESVRNHYMFTPYLDAGVRHFQPVPSSFAGVWEWMQVRDMAVRSGIRFFFGRPAPSCLSAHCHGRG